MKFRLSASSPLLVALEEVCPLHPPQEKAWSWSCSRRCGLPTSWSPSFLLLLASRICLRMLGVCTCILVTGGVSLSLCINYRQCSVSSLQTVFHIKCLSLSFSLPLASPSSWKWLHLLNKRFLDASGSPPSMPAHLVSRRSPAGFSPYQPPLALGFPLPYSLLGHLRSLPK